MNLVGLLERILRDIQYGTRAIRKNHTFAVTAVLILALGMGATTAIFTVVYGVLLKPLGYSDPNRLVRISGAATVARFEAISKGQSFAKTGAFNVVTENVTLSGANGPEALKGARVSANFLQTLGVAPLLGRGFLAEEERAGQQVAMISEGLWRGRFGADPNIIGRTARLAAAPYMIVGVLPSGFQFPFPGVDVWRTLRPQTVRTLAENNSTDLSVFGRLKPNVSLEQASAELEVINHQYALAYPGRLDVKRKTVARVEPLKDDLVRNVRSMLWILLGSVVFVLIIACSNVAGLLLARATSRSREFAVKAALGASRSRLVGELLVESLLLAFAAGALGLVLSNWFLDGIKKMPGLELPRTGEIHLDATIFGFAVALSVATSLFFGLAPAVSASRPDLTYMMKTGGEAPVNSPRRLRLGLSFRGLLVIGQMALSVVLLIGATLLIQSLTRLYRVDTGFNVANLLTMQVALPQGRYDMTQKSSAFFDELVSRVESIKGVRSAAVTLTLPMTGYAGTPIHLVGQPVMKLNERPIATLQSVTPGYFRTLEIPVRRGRGFADRDTASTTPVVVIDESLARRFWPAYPKGEDPIGHFVLLGISPQPLRIIGIVADVRQAGRADDAWPGVYRPRSQTPPFSAMFAIRTEGDSLRLVNAIREQVVAIDPDQAVTEIKTMAAIVDESEGQRHSVMVLLGLFAGAALLLALVGVYGVMAYSVVRRTKELGIRQALGARRHDILSLILGQGLWLALTGVAAGVGGALALTQVMKSLLFEVSVTDPLTFVGVALSSTLVAMVACYIPARHATRIDPIDALRVE